MSEITRRQFLQAAGGITFLALMPSGSGLFAAADTGIPKFTALPYVQPGNSSALRDGHEAVVIAWQTEFKPAGFILEYGPTKSYGKRAKIARTQRRHGAAETDQCYNYAADLSGLNLSRQYYYRLRSGAATIAEGYFTTRKKRGEAIRFVAFGDNAYGDPGQRAIAYYAYQARPDFIMNTGDNVYESGLDSQYIEYFYPIYNADTPDPKVGAPLLRSVPFYTVMANHDVAHKDAAHQPYADFDKEPDSLAYYTAMHLPLNGPRDLASPTAIKGAKEPIDAFKACAGQRFPRMANYSFDYGDIHFLCLDSNVYVDTSDKALHDWIEADLKATDAPWKIVVFHHPSFNAGDKHYAEQRMRVFSPVFEAQGVDLCLHGHEHTYQRTQPLRFKPSDAIAKTNPADHRVPGVFTVDNTFDGTSKTKPDGIIYITTGAGGKELYDPDFDDAPEKWRHADDNNVAYVARFFSSKHSLTVIDVEGPTLKLSQIDEDGKEVDLIQVTKA
jgi:hypothetical protein